MYHTIKNAKEIKAEERAYRDWERQEKNRILNMSNVQKKQEAWRQLFPQVTHSDDYLFGNVY